MKDLAFDVGANVGKITDMLLLQYSKVIAVEANEALCQKLIKKYDDNVVVVNRALSDVANVRTPFYISPENTISTLSMEWIKKSRFSESSKWNDPVWVLTSTLDVLIEKHGTPDIIKIDVEGYELIVLQGLSAPVEFLCLEWVDELFENTVNCVSRLQEIGYKEFSMVYGEYQPNQEQLAYQDWDAIQFDTKAKKRYGMLWAHHPQGNA